MEAKPDRKPPSIIIASPNGLFLINGKETDQIDPHLQTVLTAAKAASSPSMARDVALERISVEYKRIYPKGTHRLSSLHAERGASEALIGKLISKNDKVIDGKEKSKFGLTGRAIMIAGAMLAHSEVVDKYPNIGGVKSYKDIAQQEGDTLKRAVTPAVMISHAGGRISDFYSQDPNRIDPVVYYDFFSQVLAHEQLGLTDSIVRENGKQYPLNLDPETTEKAIFDAALIIESLFSYASIRAGFESNGLPKAEKGAFRFGKALLDKVAVYCARMEEIAFNPSNPNFSAIKARMEALIRSEGTYTAALLAAGVNGSDSVLRTYTQSRDLADAGIHPVYFNGLAERIADFVRVNRESIPAILQEEIPTFYHDDPYKRMISTDVAFAILSREIKGIRSLVDYNRYTVFEDLLTELDGRGLINPSFAEVLFDSEDPSLAQLRIDVGPSMRRSSIVVNYSPDQQIMQWNIVERMSEEPVALKTRLANSVTEFAIQILKEIRAGELARINRSRAIRTEDHGLSPAINTETKPNHLPVHPATRKAERRIRDKAGGNGHAVPEKYTQSGNGRNGVPLRDEILFTAESFDKATEGLTPPEKKAAEDKLAEVARTGHANAKYLHTNAEDTYLEVKLRGAARGGNRMLLRVDPELSEAGVRRMELLGIGRRERFAQQYKKIFGKKPFKRKHTKSRK